MPLSYPPFPLLGIFRHTYLDVLSFQWSSKLSASKVLTHILPAQGIGGAGKSTLAAAVARDEEVQWRFKDGVFWIMMGPNVNPMIKAEELKVNLHPPCRPL